MGICHPFPLQLYVEEKVIEQYLIPLNIGGRQGPHLLSVLSSNTTSGLDGV